MERRVGEEGEIESAILFIRYQRNRVSHLVYQVLEEQSQPYCLSGIRGIDSAILVIRYSRNLYGGVGVSLIFFLSRGGAQHPLGPCSSCLSGIRGIQSATLLIRYQRNRVSHLVYQVLEEQSQPSYLESIRTIQLSNLLQILSGQSSQPSC